GVGVWRSEDCRRGVSIRGSRAGDAKREAVVWGGNRRAPTYPALLYVRGGQHFAVGRIVVLGLDLHAGTQAEDELRLVWAGHLNTKGIVVEDGFFVERFPAIQIAVQTRIDIQAGQVNMRMDAEEV